MQQQTQIPKKINPKNQIMANISPSRGSLPAIIRSYKSAVTKCCNENELQFGWQSRFHDHIIRNALELRRIRNYIIQNPAKWKEDCF